MTLMRNIRRIFDDLVFSVETTNDLFNQYLRIDDRVDTKDAAEIRRKNLDAYISHFMTSPSVLLIGEATGYNGCRNSGIPFTCEEQLRDRTFFMTGRQSTIGSPKVELSAKIFWKELQPVHDKFFVVNAVPLHPHVPGSPMSNRTPRAEELDRFEDFRASIIDALDPTRIVCIGRKAESCLKKSGYNVGDVMMTNDKVVYVRHTARGGATKFGQGMERLFGYDNHRASMVCSSPSL